MHLLSIGKDKYTLLTSDRFLLFLFLTAFLSDKEHTIIVSKNSAWDSGITPFEKKKEKESPLNPTLALILYNQSDQLSYH